MSQKHTNAENLETIINSLSQYMSTKSRRHETCLRPVLLSFGWCNDCFNVTGYDNKEKLSHLLWGGKSFIGGEILKKKIAFEAVVKTTDCTVSPSSVASTLIGLVFWNRQTVFEVTPRVTQQHKLEDWLLACNSAQLVQYFSLVLKRCQNGLHFTWVCWLLI